MARELRDRNRRTPRTVKECPSCHNAPELVVLDGRHVPKYCATCDGSGVVPLDFRQDQPPAA